MSRLHRFLCCLAAMAGVSATAVAEIPIGGQVLGPDGQGLRGIRVGLEPIKVDFERVETRLDGRVGPPFEIEVTTDDEGYFELAAPRPGAWKVVVAPESTAYVASEFILRPLYEPTELSPLELQPASTLEVRVVDQEGVPAAARIGLSDNRRSQDDWRSRLRLAHTDDGGIARLPRGRDEELRLELLGPANPIIVFTGDDLDAGDGVPELKLVPGIAGTVRVTDRLGEAVAGAVVYQGSGVLPLGRTDDEGRLDVVLAAPEHDPPGVSVLARGALLGHFEPRFSKEQDATNDATVTVEPLRRVRGQVVDLESREPVEKAVVWVANGPVAETDGHGMYELPLFPSSRLNVQAAAEGYAWAMEQTVLESPVAENGPTIALAPAARVSGVVVDVEDRPIAGVKVTSALIGRHRAFRSMAYRGFPETRSTRRGRFFLSGFPPSATFELEFRKPGFAPARHKVEGLEAFEDRGGLRIVLDQGTIGIGLVVGADEVGVPGADVRLRQVDPGDPRSMIRMSSTGEPDASQPAALTDPEGRFRLPNLAEGRYNLEVKAPGFAPATVPGLQIEDASGEVDFGTVVLSPGARLEGVVRDESGAALAEVDVYARQEQRPIHVGQTEPQARTDTWGRFAVPDLKAGETYLLTFSKTGYAAETASATAAEGESVEVVLRRAGTISGRVRNEERDAVKGAIVMTTPADMNRQRYVFGASQRPVQTDEQGSFRLENVEPGGVTLMAQTPGYQTYELHDLRVRPGEELAGIEIVLVRGATITGTVREADGTPVVRARVSYSAPQPVQATSYGRASGETDGEGRFRLTGVPPGPAVVTAQQGDHRQVSKTVEVEDGVHVVDLVFEGGFEVSGQVFDATGAALPGVQLTLMAMEAGVQRFFGHTQPMTTGPDGTFTLTGVAPGRYALTAAKEGYAAASTPEPFQVSDAPVTGIVLELRRGITLRGRVLGLELDELADVVVQAFGGSTPGAVQQGVVDYEGLFTLPNLGPGSWTVMARVGSSGRSTTAQLKVAEGDVEAELDIEFKPGFSFEGRVVSGGEPYGGAQVFISGMAPGLGSAQVTTSSDGRFQVKDLPAGNYQLMVLAGTSHPSRSLEVPTNEEVVIDVSLARIAGFVRDEQGEPIVGAAIRLERADVDTTKPYAVTIGGFAPAQTDSRGYFSVDTQQGVWRVVAEKAGYGPAQATVDLAAGGGDALELSMSPTEGLTFEVVVDSGGVTYPVTSVVVDPASGRVLSHVQAPPEGGGTVRLSSVPPGTWELYVQAGDSATVATTVTAPGHAGQVRLPQGGHLRLRVPALGEQPTAAEVELVGPDGRPYRSLEQTIILGSYRPFHNGETTYSRLAPGLWKFTITLPDGTTKTGEATISPGTTAQIMVP